MKTMVISARKEGFLDSNIGLSIELEELQSNYYRSERSNCSSIRICKDTININKVNSKLFVCLSSRVELYYQH